MRRPMMRAEELDALEGEIRQEMARIAPEGLPLSVEQGETVAAACAMVFENRYAAMLEEMFADP